MPIRPAYETTLRHGDHAVTLRADMRAAVALDALPGGFEAIVTGVMWQSYSAIRSVIAAAATDRAQADSFLAACARLPLAPFIPAAQAATLSLIANILPEPAEAAESRTTTATTTWGEYLSDLFGYATGWLGWTPSEVWNTSPREIEAAFAAHVDRLVRTTPGASSTAREATSDDYDDDLMARLQDPNDATLDPHFDRAGLRRLQAQTG